MFLWVSCIECPESVFPSGAGVTDACSDVGVRSLDSGPFYACVAKPLFNIAYTPRTARSEQRCPAVYYAKLGNTSHRSRFSLMEGAPWDRPFCQGLDLNHAVLSLYIPFQDCVKLVVVGRVTSVSPVSEKGLWGTTVPP